MQEASRRFLVVLSALCLGVFSAHAGASPIALSAGDKATFNFDFSSASLAPPYDGVFTVFEFENFGADDTVFFEVFGDLDAQGLFGGTTLSFSSPFVDDRIRIDPPNTIDAFLDGAFSIVVNAAAGAFSIVDTYGEAGIGCIVGPCPRTRIDGVPVAVPAPATAVLLSLGAILLGARRRWIRQLR